MFSSEEPTYLLKISGPLTILGSFALSIVPILLAIKVLPVPGGPNNRPDDANGLLWLNGNLFANPPPNTEFESEFASFFDLPNPNLSISELIEAEGRSLSSSLVDDVDVLKATLPFR
ncbi:hypothetical protein WICMUC_004393 [Wickerhamomyces mucosus]|uniref:Uncharacterized protein n=1 Tax=Wickerhamomyces mucosus TaxID=1378264 RepID=A0A9P8PH92_9ASCO|nr:hypothetical protein WICMUC_004393 [Wickerhamomyces mucosus]